MSQIFTLHVSDLLLSENVVVDNYQRVLTDNFLWRQMIAKLQ